MEGKPLRVTVRVRNNRLIGLREEMGWTQREAAARVGMSVSQLLALETLRQSALSPSAEGWRPVAVLLSEFYGVELGWLFPADLDSIRSSQASAELDFSQARQLADVFGSPTKQLEASEVKNLLGRLVKSAETKDRRSVGCFLRHESGETYDQIGNSMGLSRERVRQLCERGRRFLQESGGSGS